MSEKTERGAHQHLISWFSQDASSAHGEAQAWGNPKEGLCLNNNFGGIDTEPGPCGASGHKAFLCPHFMIIGSSLHSASNLHWFPRGIFKQQLVKEGRGCKTRSETVKRNSSAALEPRSRFPINRYTQQYLWAVLQILKSLRWEKLIVTDGTLPTKACRLQNGWDLKADDADSCLPYHQPIRRMFRSRSHPLTIKLLSSPSWDTWFWHHEPAVSLAKQ